MSKKYKVFIVGSLDGYTGRSLIAAQDTEYVQDVIGDLQQDDPDNSRSSLGYGPVIGVLEGVTSDHIGVIFEGITLAADLDDFEVFEGVYLPLNWRKHLDVVTQAVIAGWDSCGMGFPDMDCGKISCPYCICDSRNIEVARRLIAKIEKEKTNGY